MSDVSTVRMRSHEAGASARRHGVVLRPVQRRSLERAGWRTTLEYQEIHVRGRNGQLIEVIPKWIAEAERYGGRVEFISAEGATADLAWEHLEAKVNEPTERHRSRVRLV
jgi:hypothetical protein